MSNILIVYYGVNVVPTSVSSCKSKAFYWPPVNVFNWFSCRKLVRSCINSWICANHCVVHAGSGLRPVLDRSPIFQSQKCQMLMDFLIRGLRPVLDRSPIFEKFMPKLAPFMQIFESFMQIIDFGEKICNFHDYM